MRDGGAWTTHKISQAMVPHNSGNSQENINKVNDRITAQQQEYKKLAIDDL